MGYFSNGTEGEMYEAAYCRRCRHYGPVDGPGCTVWLLHLLHNYGQEGAVKEMLTALIPRTADGIGNQQCRMFLAKPQPPQKRRLLS